MSGFVDRFTRRYDRAQERKKLTAEIVDPNAPPLPDTPVEQIRSERAASRNSPCPCGSGKKFKKCCGKAP